jgi:hypothetical protein
MFDSILFYDWTFFDVMRECVFWTSPIVFIIGVVLLMYGNYKNFEALMLKEYGLRNKILPEVEKNIYSFHDWCMKKHILIGMVCIVYSLVVFLVLKRFSSLGEVIGDMY